MELFEKVKKKFFELTYKKAKLSSPSTDEQKLINELRSRIIRLSKSDTATDSKVKKGWVDYKTKIRQLILNDDPRDFINWEVVKKTMFFEPPIRELEFLQKLPDWSQWKKAMKESPIGNPKPYWAFKESSGLLIHHAYHLAQLVVKSRCSIEDMTQVVEFGGGYGSMCRLVHQLGFDRRYIIFDLPEFTALQEFFLKSVGISSEIIKNATNVGKCIVLLSDINELSKQLTNQIDNYIFIATWSISEAPTGFRKQIFNLVPNAKYYLIAYQDEFEGIDNLQYFSEFAKSKPEYFWQNDEIEALKGHYYLIGRKKSDSD